MSLISQKLQAVHTSIQAAAGAVSRRPDSVALLAVSKTFGADAVMQAIAAGQRAFGENYLQEAIDKMAAVKVALTGTQYSGVLLEWHFIGPIQSNKTKPIAEHFDWVHTVDREKIAQRLSAQRPPHLPPLNVCLQVNISGEASKSGLAPSAVLDAARAIIGLPQLTLRGLMTIPEPTEDEQKQRAAFRQTRELLQQLQSELPLHAAQLDTLSMGMSADMAAAIAEGATIVRVGSAIFGHRAKPESQIE
ncbi:alanine racemase, N-terminal domain protein [Collimonas arenae]|uniref:Pyridoxal phosphate homeostasis protein n=1 Tax=Collimonas arenae TaxID=279058 RepID=A0A127QEN8_9BURK|nr:YggS family pyridoxal phosphate-dependent enzyme [Collimonas arenae]AMO98640.1 alanine racemase, N-terminal domain protein [Collimonas arenae]AMP08527.1 alanine racemase, N-terminal domain protein [Collimonas arenae]